jgi:transcriptional regulator with PAS, ATPase and Fis domain
MQPKLLRVLEEKEMERLGGTHLTKSDFRLIAATHENLEISVEQGRFRKDLFYRLNVIPIQIPPLRERREDIPVIISYLIENLNRDLGTKVVKVSPEALHILQHYGWPGNVRELTNVLERVLYSVEGDTIYPHHLPLFLQTLNGGAKKSSSTLLKRLKQDMEREALLHAMRVSHDNKNKAAKLLGIHRTALYKKMKKFSIPLNPGAKGHNYV